MPRPEPEDLDEVLEARGLRPIVIDVPEGCYLTYSPRRVKLYCRDPKVAVESVASQVGCNPYLGELVDLALRNLEKLYSVVQGVRLAEDVEAEVRAIHEWAVRARRELATVKAQLSAEVLVVRVTVPHEYTKAMGAEYVVEGGRHTFLVNREYERVLRNFRVWLATALEEAGCMRFKEGVYMCPPESREELEAVKRKAYLKIGALGEAAASRLRIDILEVRMAPADLVELVEATLESVTREAEEKGRKLEELKEKRKKSGRLQNEVSALHQKIERLRDWLQRLRQMARAT